MDSLESGRIVKRVISEVAGTISTNGIQELSHEERGGMSDYLYVRDCLVMTAYNAVRALPGFNMTVNEFYRAVDAHKDFGTNNTVNTGADGLLPALS